MPRGHLIKDWMTTETIAVTPETQMLQAIFLMQKNRIRFLPVTTGDLIVGVITDRDVRNPVKSLKDLNVATLYKNEGNIPVKHVMKTKLICVTPTDHIATAANLIVKNKISGLPVVEKKDSANLVGVITTTDLLKAFMDLMDKAKW